jgi:hypothetical protein
VIASRLCGKLHDFRFSLSCVSWPVFSSSSLRAEAIYEASPGRCKSGTFRHLTNISFGASQFCFYIDWTRLLCTASTTSQTSHPFFSIAIGNSSRQFFFFLCSALAKLAFFPLRLGQSIVNHYVFLCFPNHASAVDTSLWYVIHLSSATFYCNTFVMLLNNATMLTSIEVQSRTAFTRHC